MKNNIQALQLYEGGMRVNEIAKQRGLTRQRVYQQIEKARNYLFLKEKFKKHNLSLRVMTALYKSGVTSSEQIEQMTVEKLMKCRNIGRPTAEMIKNEGN